MCPSWTSLLSQSLCSWSQAAMSSSLLFTNHVWCWRNCGLSEENTWGCYPVWWSCWFFPFALFFDSMLRAFPISARHWHRVAPGTVTWGVTWSSQPIWSKLYFSQGRDDPISHSSSAGGSKATAPPCVLSSGCVRKSLYVIHSGNHHLGSCSWDAAREGKLGFLGKQHQGGGSKARSMVHRFLCCPSANW